MAEGRTFRERVKSAAKKSALLLKKLSPERAVSKIRLNLEFVRLIEFMRHKPLGSGMMERLAQLADAGANVNSRTSDGATALMIAAYYGCMDVCVSLLLKGANLYAKDKKGKTVFTFDIFSMPEGSDEHCERLRARSKTMKLLKSIVPLWHFLDMETFKAFLPAFRECVV